ncbi:hypothetical protein GCM10029992_08720 [Glycomyces albus]
MAREFDPDEVQYFKAILEAEKQYLEDEVINQLRPGEVLNYAPAFGITPAADTKLAEYKGDFDTLWGDLQGLKATLSGMIDAMETALEGHEITEETNVQGLQALEESAAGRDPADESNDQGGGDNEFS